jgi:transcriptional regulator with XRE-family HTH domain
VPTVLDKQLAAFLKKRRGTMSYGKFSQKVGLPPSTLYRLERGEQSITLGRLHQLMQRLRCKLTDIFPTQE